MTARTNVPDPLPIVELRRLIEKSGAPLQLLHPSHYHWRIVGGLHTVNWYPESRRQMMYVNGATSGRTATARHVLEAALGTLTDRVGARRGHRKNTGRIKRSLYREDPHCFWCGCRVWLGVECDPMILATLDHKIPVAKGGSSRRDNAVLACQRCNHDRADNLGAPPTLQGSTDAQEEEAPHECGLPGQVQTEAGAGRSTIGDRVPEPAGDRSLG